MRHIHAEPVDAAVAPKAQRALELLAHVGMLPVKIGLLGGKQMQVPFAVLDALPRRAAETRHPAVRGKLTVLPAARPEDVAFALGRAGARGERRLEETVVV